MKYDLTDFIHFISPCTDARDYLYAYHRKGTMQEAYDHCEQADWYLYALSDAARGVRRESMWEKLEQFSETMRPFVAEVTKRYQELVLPSWMPTTFLPLEQNPHYQTLVNMTPAALYDRYLKDGALFTEAEVALCQSNRATDFIDNYNRRALTYLNPARENSPAFALWALKTGFSRDYFSRIYNGVRIYLLHSAHNSVQLLGMEPHRSFDQAVEAHIQGMNRVFAHLFQEHVSFDAYHRLMVALIADNRREVY